MKKTIVVLAFASVFTAGNVFGSGFRIPEQSADSTAKAGANVASALGADAAYYNPANMSWMKNSNWLFEVDLTGIYLTAVDYTDARSPYYDDQSEDESFLLPTFFLVSPEFNKMRFGLSFTAPFGLAKRWENGFGRTFAEEFSLKVFDLNPVLSYKINDTFSVAGGARIIYSDASVKSNGYLAYPYYGIRDVSGDGLDFGYNLAVSAKPSEQLNLSVTYRSLVEMNIEGDAYLATNLPIPSWTVKTGGDVVVPSPAILSLSGAYDFGRAKVEFTFDRTFWEEWKSLDVDYNVPITNPLLFTAFDRPALRNWQDSNCFRLSVEYDLNPSVVLMGGFAYDENPIPDETLDFTLPDSDAYLFSAGARFKVGEKGEIAAAVLYDYKESRETAHGAINGEFTNSTATLVSVGYSYEF